MKILTYLTNKKTYLEKEWATVDQDKLFDFAKIDEVTSHIAIILKASDLKYDPKYYFYNHHIYSYLTTRNHRYHLPNQSKVNSPH